MDAGYARFRRKLTYSEVFFRKRFDAKYLHQVSKPVCCITLEPVSLTLHRSVLGSRVSDTKTVPGDTGYALPISRIHLVGYLVEDGITSSVHAKHTFSRTSIMLRMRIKSRRVSLERWFDVKYLSCRYDRYCCLTSHNVYTWYLS